MDNKSIFLIVDDEPEMCWVLDSILRKAGGICHTASSAKDALALAEHQTFTTAFLDAKLPDGDGLDLARLLLASDPKIRIIIVSGYFYQDDPIIIAALLSRLISAFVSKPFNNDDILRSLVPQQPATGNNNP